ncbi:hypothetical protein KPH14_004973 [Odynerus spinipes]|uniref:NF-X1-type zinc finger protein NFXL1 n=1 Tax=Odynerus spinipes TaxID=1348599 RepID=A0AAD9RMY2_9HYME|nr:hypothetical protein KPH14_004973 [Odynerus spinipes]
MQKFKRAQIENKMSIKRHLEANTSLDSSSEDEDNICEEDIQKTLGEVISAYEGGLNTEQIISYLINIFQSGGAICLICISTVKKVDAIWSCNKCYSFMHLSCILHWIRDTLANKREKGITPTWTCPKCRTEYGEDQIPRVYKCFCKKVENPPYQTWLIPHSCGETCGKSLEPKCGHKCVLLCHPGPCPPCAKMVMVKCYCEKQPARPLRCNTTGWSCYEVCNKKYDNCKHTCKEICHSGECPPCSETLEMECRCKSSKQVKKCDEITWTCDRPCNKLLSCKIHICEGTCHSPEDCGNCPPNKFKTCPCGKKRYIVSCKDQQVSKCGSTCGKLLNCGLHRCNMICHSEQCGQCLEMVVKSCRCGSYTKEVACGKEFHCNKKCTQIRLCGRHLCNKKCCDCLIKNTSNVCEKVCNNLLNCQKHKCPAACHSGPCYPCVRTDIIQCRCGNKKITIPCGTKKRIKPPPCNKPCKIPSICIHPKRETHKCHQGPCPPCKKICGLTHKKCGHNCPATCHSKVWVKVTLNGTQGQPKGPWEKPRDTLELKTLPCPPCEVPVKVECLGGHETRTWPCYIAKADSCGRPCGRLLQCTNHTCELMCHAVKSSEGITDNAECMQCDRPCSFERPNGCSHKCPKLCHPAPCDPCQQLVRVPCHCGISTLYRRCIDLTSATAKKREELLKCGNQCPKNYPCGHRCNDICHPGECKRQDTCNKKIKLWCKCKRIKKEYICSFVQEKQIVIECDSVCQSLINERNEAKKIKELQRQREEELRNQEEIEKFQRKFKPRRKVKDKLKNKLQNSQTGDDKTYKLLWISSIFVAMISIVGIYVNLFYFNQKDLEINSTD